MANAIAQSVPAPRDVPRQPVSAVRAGDAIDLSMLLNILRRRWRLASGVLVLVTLAAVAAAFLIPRVYTATANLKIDPNEHLATDLSQATTNGPPDQAIVDSEVAVMKSREVARRVVEQLKLTSDEEFKPKHGHFAPGTPGYEEGVIDEVLGKLDAKRETTTYIIDLNFKSKDPQKAARIANAFAQDYIATSIGLKTSTAAQQSDWLRDRLQSLGADVDRAQSAAARYRIEHGIAAGAVGGTVTDQQIGTITTQLATAESEAAAARSNYEAAQAQASRGTDAVSSVLNSPTIVDLRRQRAEVTRDMADVRTHYGPRHPESIKVQQQLDSIDSQIRDETQRIIAGLASDARASEARAGALRNQLDGLTGRLASNSQSASEADTLQKQADSRQALYAQLAASAQQATQAQHANQTEAQIIGNAATPTEPSFPKKPLFAALGLVVGLILSVALVFALESLDVGVRTVEDVEQRVGIPFIAAAPLIGTGRRIGRVRVKRGAAWDFVIDKPMSGYAEALRNTRSALSLGQVDRRVKTIAITSALPGEGKTVTAVSLARIMAMSGDRAVLMDCDLRQNAMHGLLNEAPKAGLVEVLTGRAMLDEVLQPDKVKGLDILPLTKSAYMPQDLLGSAAMSKLLEGLVERYDVVVLDCPPILAVADARTLSALADATLMVVRWGRTSRHAVRAALTLLESDGSYIAGTVLNMVDTRARGAIGAANPAYYYNANQPYYVE